MLWSLLAVTVVSAAVLYVLYHWLIPTAVQSSGWLALLWHDVIHERLLDIMTGTSRPQVTLTVIHRSHIRRDEMLMFKEDRESLLTVMVMYHENTVFWRIYPPVKNMAWLYDLIDLELFLYI